MHFHQNQTKIVENIHLDGQTDAQTGLILRVKIFSPVMTEYKNIKYQTSDMYVIIRFFPQNLGKETLTICSKVFQTLYV